MRGRTSLMLALSLMVLTSSDSPSRWAGPVSFHQVAHASKHILLAGTMAIVNHHSLGWLVLISIGLGTFRFLFPSDDTTPRAS